jgi:hypothetical protein
MRAWVHASQIGLVFQHGGRGSGNIYAVILTSVGYNYALVYLKASRIAILGRSCSWHKIWVH